MVCNNKVNKSFLFCLYNNVNDTKMIKTFHLFDKNIYCFKGQGDFESQQTKYSGQAKNATMPKNVM